MHECVQRHEESVDEGEIVARVRAGMSECGGLRFVTVVFKRVASGYEGWHG